MSAAYPSPGALLAKHGLRAKKSWGQNFLGDPGILDHIARLAAPDPGELVVELGAGLGHLTVRLLGRGATVVAVERDRDMARVLRAELGERVRVLETNAVKVDYATLAGGKRRVSVAGNLPYHLTSPILFSLLDQVAHLSRAVLLLQREVAERLAAGPAARERGLLSVLLQRLAAVEVTRRVPPGAFLPPPKVESAVLAVRFGAPRARVLDEPRFRRLVKAGFAQRRKTLWNALGAARLAEPRRLAAALEAAGVDPRRRGETLSVEEWAALERALG